MTSNPQQALEGLPSPLLQRLCVFDATPSCDELINSILRRAINIVNGDTQLAPESKNFIIKSVLGKKIAPHRYLTAESIIKTVEQGGTANMWYFYLRKGIDYLRYAGNRRRPKDRLKQRSPISRCEVTGNGGLLLKGCRIFPFPISNEDVDNDHLWNLLRCFWNSDTVEMIKVRCGPDSINDFANGIVMATEVYNSFNNLGFYLVPELDTVTLEKYSVIFHWTRKPERIPNFWAQEYMVGDMAYFPVIDSGQRIVFETVDPVLFPLPDPGLLIVRALLAKISHPPPRDWIDEIFGGHEPIEDDQSAGSGSSFGCNSSNSCSSINPRCECVHSRRTSISTMVGGKNADDRQDSVLICAKMGYIQDWLDRGGLVLSYREDTAIDSEETFIDFSYLRVSCAVAAESGLHNR